MSAPITTSVFEIFKIGLGPSASHTTGPMLAAAEFREHLLDRKIGSVAGILVELHGSLGATGRGHATDRAVIGGLTGLRPAHTGRAELATILQEVWQQHEFSLAEKRVSFDPERDILWRPETPRLPHPNTLDFTARDAAGQVLLRERYLSVGGGFVEWVQPDGTRQAIGGQPRSSGEPRYAFRCAADLRQYKLSWWQIALANECSLRAYSEAAVFSELTVLWQAMRECIAAGLETEGELPGPLRVNRRAPAAYRAAMGDASQQRLLRDPLDLLTHAYALAVNEENAAGHKVVTAPTNGAAGLLPGVFAAFQDTRQVADATIGRGLLTAGLIGSLIKARASLSGAEMGCQGEVGAAAAMAAGGLVEMVGGIPDQVEMAAEICIEHHLGLTCDPVGGLVQIPCIERNVMGAVKALNAATLALASDGQHKISLDAAIEAMRQTGTDMHRKYKETAEGGLAKVAHDLAHVQC